MERNRVGVVKISCIALIFMGMFASTATAQVAPDRYLVYFTDKASTPYSVEEPQAFLSERAILRRCRQGIPVVMEDLPVDPAYVSALKTLGELQVLQSLKWFNAVLIQSTDSVVVDAVLNAPFVDRVEVAPVIHAVRNPVHPVRRDAKSGEGEYGDAFNQIDMLNGLGLHHAGYRGQGKWIAVLDGGFSGVPTAPAFQRLYDQGRLIATRNFVDPALDVYRSSHHGSYVLSTMAGYEPDSIIGTAPDASYILCLTEDVAHERPIEEAWWAAAAAFADSAGADVINSSLGYTEFDDGMGDHTYADMDGNTTLITRAADKAAAKGILVVTSAGNSGLAPWHFISAPADGDSVLAVAAATPEGIVAGFSSRGPSADGRTKPDVMAQGAPAAVASMDGGAFFGSGTSFASPILAGMAASLWQAAPRATAMQVYHAIRRSSSLYGQPNDSAGYGIPDFAMALDILAAQTGGRVSVIRGLGVYPNPYSGGDLQLFLPGDRDIGALVSVFDVNGRKVYARSFDFCGGEARLPMPGLAAGVYVLRIRCTDGTSRTAKLTVSGE